MPTLQYILDEQQIENSEQQISKLKNPTYSEVFWRYLHKNFPFVVSDSIVCEASDWCHDGKPNMEVLLEKYGTYTVPVVDCDSFDRKKMLFSDYAKYWTSRSSHSPLLYLKDWHLKRQIPSNTFYRVPEIFASDWLNEYSVDKNIDDFMFVYMGPKGSWTPFHADVYSSFSWSANVVGEKRWLLFPPGEELKFVDSLGNLPQNIDTRLIGDLKYYELIQNAGEVLFVPSNWYHQVFNTEDTISINHNWVNACNINFVWSALKKHLDLVEKEISEFKHTDGWSEHCQLMLRALFGMNLHEFIEMIEHIATKRLKSLEDNVPIQFNQWEFGNDHNIYDLKKINELLKMIVSDKKCDELYKNNNIRHLLHRISVFNL